MGRRLCGGLPLFGLLRLAAMQKIRRALRMRRRAEYRPLVVLQHLDPRRHLRRMILPNPRRECEVSAGRRAERTKLGDKLFDGVTFIAKSLAAEFAICQATSQFFWYPSKNEAALTALFSVMDFRRSLASERRPFRSVPPKIAL